GVAAGDLDRPVAALRVEDEDLVGEAVDALQTAFDVGLLVAGGHQDGKGDHRVSSSQTPRFRRSRRAPSAYSFSRMSRSGGGSPKGGSSRSRGRHWPL